MGGGAVGVLGERKIYGRCRRGGAGGCIGAKIEYYFLFSFFWQ